MTVPVGHLCSPSGSVNTFCAYSTGNFRKPRHFRQRRDAGAPELAVVNIPVVRACCTSPVDPRKPGLRACPDVVLSTSAVFPLAAAPITVSADHSEPRFTRPPMSEECLPQPGERHSTGEPAVVVWSGDPGQVPPILELRLDVVFVQQGDEIDRDRLRARLLAFPVVGA